jgi:pimeloyl-ACP methyl ester carboxylesterase
MIELGIFSQGSGPARAVLLGPMAASALVWRRLLSALRSDLEVLTVEFPGCGDTPFQAVASIHDLVDAVVGQIGRLEEKPLHLVGYSLGSWVAQGVASRVSQLRSLSLIGSSLHTYPMGTQLLQSWLRLLRRGDFDGVLEQMALWSHSPRSFESLPDLLGRVVAGCKKALAGPFVLENQLQLAHDHTSPMALAGLSCRKLVLRGAWDIFFPRWATDCLREAIGSHRFVELPGVAHAALAEDHEAVLRELRQTFQEPADLAAPAPLPASGASDHGG